MEGKSPYQWMGMKEAGQPVEGERAWQDLLKLDSQVRPRGEPVTAGRPSCRFGWDLSSGARVSM